MLANNQIETDCDRHDVGCGEEQLTGKQSDNQETKILSKFDADANDRLCGSLFALDEYVKRLYLSLRS